MKKINFDFFLTYSSRRNNKSDDGFNGKRCITWFREYTTPDDPDTLGKQYVLFHIFFFISYYNLL